MATQFELNKRMTELYNMKSDCKQLDKKVDLLSEMSKKEFIDMADGHVKDMNQQIE